MRWVATPTVGAPLVAHVLAIPSAHRGTGIGMVALALCGEGRKRWQPIGEFAVPSAFRRCDECARRAAAPAGERWDG